MFNYLVTNFKMIGALLVMYIFSFGANTLLGLYYNISSIKTQFEKSKLLSGLAKGGIILVGMALIVTVISILPQIIECFGLSVDEQIFDGISAVAMAVVMVSIVVYYLKDAIQKLYNILYGKNIEQTSDVETVETTSIETTETTEAVEEEKAE